MYSITVHVPTCAESVECTVSKSNYLCLLNLPWIILFTNSEAQNSVCTFSHVDNAKHISEQLYFIF